MVLKYYFDLMSQPARACYMFLKINKIPFVPCPVAIRKLEHRGEDFTRINPFQRLPVIDDHGFVLTESNAILKYLAIDNNVSDNWYPKDDIKLQARIDEYLHWHHWNIRWNGSMFFITRVVKPMMTGKDIDHKKLEMYKHQLNESTNLFEKYFLARSPFISSDNVSIADLQALCEFMQPFAAGYDVFEHRPKLSAWRDRVKEFLQPHFDESHKMVYKVAKLVAQQNEDMAHL